MREELLAYLLGALDDADRRRIEAALDSDPELRRDLDTLRRELQPADPPEAFEPPTGLLEQTCNLVEGCQKQCDSRERARRNEPEYPIRSRIWSLADSLVGAGLFVAAAMLFFPAIANSRFRSDIQSCQRNLQCLGTALSEFSEVNQGVFPRIPVEGNRAAAGIYGPILVDGGFVLDTRMLVCPSSALCEHAVDWRIPTQRELDDAQGIYLDKLRRAMGGSYGYTLGYMEGNRYRPPRNERRPYFALMSDAPSLHLVGRRSDNHCGRGQNVLFEDSHIEFVVDQERAVFRDALFVNRFGFAEAGADKNDSVIGGSNTPPLLVSIGE